MTSAKEDANFRAFSEELTNREGELKKFMESKHAELTAGFRKPDSIADHFTAVYDLRAREH